MEDFKMLHNNNHNLKAQELVPYMLAQMDASALTQEERAVYEEVKAWQFNNDIDEVGPSIWRQWYGRLYNMLWDEFRVENTALRAPYTYQTIYLLKHHGDHEFMDILETEDKTETAKDLFLLAFKSAAKSLIEIKEKEGDYTWANYKGTYAGHLLQALPAFSRFDIPIGGDRNIVNATSEKPWPLLAHDCGNDRSPLPPWLFIRVDNPGIPAASITIISLIPGLRVNTTDSTFYNRMKPRTKSWVLKF